MVDVFGREKIFFGKARQGKASIIFFAVFSANFSSSLSFASRVCTVFYDAAICNPPCTTGHATELNDEDEKLVKPEKSLMNKLPFGGFKPNEVVFSGTMTGVLMD